MLLLLHFSCKEWSVVPSSMKALTAALTNLILEQVTAEILGTTVGFSHHSSKGVDWVFVEHDSYDRPGGLYGDENGVYGDNQVQFLPEAACPYKNPLVTSSYANCA